jgi:hypothetical protein
MSLLKVRNLTYTHIADLTAATVTITVFWNTSRCGLIQNKIQILSRNVYFLFLRKDAVYSSETLVQNYIASHPRVLESSNFYNICYSHNRILHAPILRAQLTRKRNLRLFDVLQLFYTCSFIYFFSVLSFFEWALFFSFCENQLNLHKINAARDINTLTGYRIYIPRVLYTQLLI